MEMEQIARTPTWRVLKALMLAEIDRGRDHLENIADPVMCAEIRGRVAAYRNVIRKVEGDPKPDLAENSEKAVSIY